MKKKKSLFKKFDDGVGTIKKKYSKFKKSNTAKTAKSFFGKLSSISNNAIDNFNTSNNVNNNPLELYYYKRKKKR